MTKIKLRFVVPHSLFGEGLIYMLAVLDRYEIDENAEIVIVDASMLDSVINTGAKLIVIGRENMPPPTEFERMLKLGARAYVRNGATRDALVHIIELVLHGNAVWPAEVLEGLRHPAPPFQPQLIRLSPPSHTLTEREIQLLPCLRDGMSNKAIAKHNEMAEATVKVHVKAIMRKLRLDNRTQIAVWAASNSGG